MIINKLFPGIVYLRVQTKPLERTSIQNDRSPKDLNFQNVILSYIL